MSNYPHTVINLDGHNVVPLIVEESVGVIADGSLRDPDGFIYLTELGSERPVVVNHRYVVNYSGVTAAEAPLVREAINQEAIRRAER